MPADGCCAAGSAFSVRDVEDLIQQSLTEVEPETVALNDAVGRVLAEPVLASCHMPPFDTAAMDGYALRLCDLTGPGPWHLPIGLRVAAGQQHSELPRGHCARIFTGAPVPRGADSIVMQECVQRKNTLAIIDRRPDPQSHIRHAGQDQLLGETVLAAGQRLDPRRMLAAAAAGAGTVRVRRVLSVATVTTGAELRSVGANLQPGQIWDANGPMLRAAFCDPAIVPNHAMLALDTVAEQALHLRTLAGHDLIVTTGGVSVGEEDRLVEAILRAGGEARPLKISVKPGKHLVLGKIGRAFVLGLPGNPVAAFIANRLFASVAVNVLLGTHDDRSTCFAHPAQTIIRRPGRLEYRPARIIGRGADGIQIVELAPPDFSARSGWFGAADSLAILPEDCSRVDEAEKISVLPL